MGPPQVQQLAPVASCCTCGGRGRRPRAPQMGPPEVQQLAPGPPVAAPVVAVDAGIHKMSRCQNRRCRHPQDVKMSKSDVPASTRCQGVTMSKSLLWVVKMSRCRQDVKMSSGNIFMISRCQDVTGQHIHNLKMSRCQDVKWQHIHPQDVKMSEGNIFIISRCQDVKMS